MKVFISYSSPDKEYALELAQRLRDANFEPWLDVDVAAGQNFAQEIGRALDRAKAMVVLLSPDSVKSTHVIREIEYALSEKRFKGRLIPVVTRPTREIPWVLRDLSPIELGADPRKGSKRVVDALKAS